MIRGILPFIGAVTLTIAFGVPLNAAETPTSFTCADWNPLPEREKGMFIYGYSIGVEGGAAVAQSITRIGKELGDEMEERLLPHQYRIGAIVLEVDVWCERFDNRTRDVGFVLGDIAQEKNAARIQRRLEQKIQRWLEELGKDRLKKQTTKE
jgi:hypothetical protein